MVLNGWELGGGSVRIHRADVQAKVFEALNITPEAAARQVRLSCWTRCSTARLPTVVWPSVWTVLITLMTGSESIRDVIAFPKTQRAQDLLDPGTFAGRREAIARVAHPPAQPRCAQGIVNRLLLYS